MCPWSQPLDRPLAGAGLAFLLGALAGKVALVALGPAAVAAIAARRGAAVALALFGIAGVLAAETAPPAAPLLARGTWVLEGEIQEAEGDRVEIQLAGAAPVGRPLAPADGRLPVFGDRGACGEGDRARLLVRTHTVSPFGFPGERAPPRHTVGSIVRCRPIRSSSGAHPIDRLRRRMRAAIDRALPPRQAAVVAAMAIGDRTGCDPEMRRDFSDAGLSHLLAVSGQHLSIVASLFTVVLGGLFARISCIRDRAGQRRPAALLALALVFLYTLLVGAPPSAVRAAIMVAVMLAGTLIDRRREAWSALALAAILMIARDPPVLGSLSFQLSFAAVAGLLALDRPLEARLALRRRPRLVRGIASIMITSLAATAGTAPILAYRFGRISAIGLVANVPAAPLVGLLLLPLSLLGSLAAVVFEPMGRPLLSAAGFAAEALIRLARIAASAPFATWSASPLETVLLIAALSAELLGRRRRLALLCGLTLAVAVGADRWPAGATGELVMTALPVGQGTAVLIETPEGPRMLVDTGPPDTAERVLLPYLNARRIDHLDLVVLSHPHADHTGGFAPLARRVAIDRVWTNGDRREALPDLSGRDARTVTATVTELGGIRVEVLHAEPHAVSVNDGSIVLRLSYRGRAILLAGDAERSAEREMLASGRDLSADVLVVGHHGSATSSSEAFLERVHPSIAVVPVGRDNAFHHPNPGVMARLARRGVRVLRTDLLGAITVRTDGSEISATAFLPAPPP